MVATQERWGIATFLLLFAALALGCSGGEAPDALERGSGPSAVPQESDLVLQWQLARAQAVGIVRVERVFASQWSVEPVPESPEAVPVDAVIFQDARIVIENVLFGSGFGGTRYLRALGGTIDGITISVPDQPRFAQARRYLVFVEPTRDPRTRGVANSDGVSRTWAIVGGALGAWELDDEFTAFDARERVCSAYDAITNPGQFTCPETAPLLAELVDAADIVVLAVAGPTAPDRCREIAGQTIPVRDTVLTDVTVLIGDDPAPLAIQTPALQCDGAARNPEGLVQFRPGAAYLLFLAKGESEDGKPTWTTARVWPPSTVWEIFDDLEPQLVRDGRGHALDLADVVSRLSAYRP